MTELSIDIETYSSVDLAKAGVRPYVESPDFRLLLIGYKLGGQPTRLIDLGEEESQKALTLLPPEPSNVSEGDPFIFLDYLADPNIIKTAHNASFERACLAKAFGLELPPEQWRCTMVQAATLGLPSALADVGAALGLEKQKLTEGKNLIRFFCKPAPDGHRRLPSEAPEKWERFRQYNVRDVDVEAEIKGRLAQFPRPQAEHDAWALDQRINDRGIRIDTGLLEKALELDKQYSAQLMAESKRVTGLENPRSDTQLKRWLAGRGVETDSLDKEALPALLESAPDKITRRALELRQEMGKTSIKKYEAMKRALCQDGRVHNTLQFYGAGRTGRWAGRVVQTHNLPQNKLKDLALARQLVKDGNFEMLEMAFGSPSFVLSQLIRTAFIPSEGCRFIIADYSAIEARVLAWLAGEKWVLEEFAGDGLIYEATAAMMFHAEKNDIKKGGPKADLRSKGKVATLACGYQGSVGALINMGALKSGIPEDELPGIVKRWRKANANIVRYWYDVENAAIDAVQGQPSTLAHGVHFECKAGYLFITLPSGRKLAYFKPELRPEPQFDKEGLTYMGKSQGKGQSGKYSRQKTYGGKLVENITQATARDCLRDAMTALDAAGYSIVFHVHDEIIADMPEGEGSLAEMQEIMGRPLPWAPGLPLKAEGDELPFYMKS